jgi:hypothetical protein
VNEDAQRHRLPVLRLFRLCFDEILEHCGSRSSRV